jgi:hypothetical protein
VLGKANSFLCDFGNYFASLLGRYFALLDDDSDGSFQSRNEFGNKRESVEGVVLANPALVGRYPKFVAQRRQSGGYQPCNEVSINHFPRGGVVL